MEVKTQAGAILGHRYWNSNGFGVAIVAVAGAVDWAAYIGAQPDPASEAQTMDFVSRRGSKLSEDEARALLPGVHPEALYRH